MADSIVSAMCITYVKKINFGSISRNFLRNSNVQTSTTQKYSKIQALSFDWSNPEDSKLYLVHFILSQNYFLVLLIPICQIKWSSSRLVFYDNFQYYATTDINNLANKKQLFVIRQYKTLKTFLKYSC